MFPLMSFVGLTDACSLFLIVLAFGKQLDGCKIPLVPPELLNESQHPPGCTEYFGKIPRHYKVFRGVDGYTRTL